jgi:hypothetical protein
MDQYLLYSLIGAGLVIIIYFIKPIRFIPKWIYTSVHELGHSTFSFLSGQGFQRIKLNGIHDVIRTGAHGSSEVVKPKGWTIPGIIIMSLAGYVFPLQLAVWLLLALLFNLTLGIQITLFAIPVLILLFGRNLGALYYSLLFGVIVIPVILFTAVSFPYITYLFGAFLTTTLFLEGLRSLCEVAIMQFEPQHKGGDDLNSLYSQFRIKGKVWLIVMILSLSAMIIGTGIFVRFLIT